MIKTDKPRAINFKIIDNVKNHRTGKFRPCNLYQQDLGMPQYIKTKISNAM